MTNLPHATGISLTATKKTGHLRRTNPLFNERGVAAPVIAIVMVVLVAIASFPIDLGFAWVTQTELQNIADAAALAATRQLGVVYAALPPGEQNDTNRALTADEKAQILAMAQTVGTLNKAGGMQGIAVDTATDVQIGTWDFTAQSFTPTLIRPTAVRVTARRDGGANGPIPTFFSKVMGFTEIHVNATGVAALGPLGSMSPGTADFPVGISKRWFDEGHACGDVIKFHPTGTLEGCAGWHTFTDGPANASKLRKILNDLEHNNYSSPQINAGETQLEFTGGTLASVFDDMKALYDAKKDANGQWDVKLPVYDSDDCSNPSGSLTIVGFATATVTQVVEAPNKEILAQVTCDEIEEGRPGGSMGGSGFSPLSTIPALVF